MSSTARLILKNGVIFEGKLCAAPIAVSGEVVFTTGMTGYVESITDPSYTDQIVVFTFPLLGNYGVPTSTTWESKKVRPLAVVVSEAARMFSHHSSLQSLEAWLTEAGVPLLTGVDTRALTQTIRDAGATVGAITLDDNDPVFTVPDSAVVKQVTVTRPIIYGKGKKKIIAVDCGMKENILRSLKSFPATLKRVPYNYDYTNEHFDGVFLSNGPGDPSACTETIAILKKALGFKKPIFGICLGSQLLALASGAETYKLPFGHRGHNQPCIEVNTGRCFITSQNHGYAVREETLQKDWFVSFRNLNDNSVEGIAHKTLPYFSVQFHPEAAPGPTDTRFLFEQFYKLL